MQGLCLALEENERAQMRSFLLIHKLNVVGPELCNMTKCVSLKKKGFQSSGMSGLYVHFTLDQDTSHRNSPEYFSAPEVHRRAAFAFGRCPWRG